MPRSGSGSTDEPLQDRPHRRGGGGHDAGRGHEENVPRAQELRPASVGVTPTDTKATTAVIAAVQPRMENRLNIL